PAAISSAVQAAYQAFLTCMRWSWRKNHPSPARRPAPEAPRAASAARRLLALDGGVGRLRQLQVLLQRRQRLAREALDVGVVARLRLLLELGDVLLVVVDHLVHVGAVEL